MNRIVTSEVEGNRMRCVVINIAFLANILQTLYIKHYQSHPTFVEDRAKHFLLCLFPLIIIIESEPLGVNVNSKEEVISH